jgi:hypothetical protein
MVTAQVLVPGEEEQWEAAYVLEHAFFVNTDRHVQMESPRSDVGGQKCDQIIFSHAAALPFAPAVLESALFPVSSLVCH